MNLSLSRIEEEREERDEFWSRMKNGRIWRREGNIEEDDLPDGKIKEDGERLEWGEGKEWMEKKKTFGIDRYYDDWMK